MYSNSSAMKFEIYAPRVEGNKIVSYDKIADVDTEACAVKIHDSSYSKELEDIFTKDRQIFSHSLNVQGGVGDLAKKVQAWEQENVMEIINHILPAMGFKVKVISPEGNL